ncbi:hypothetical protein [Elizabethkingia anophelis]|uniref:hypothetical protein n=1 Tax=Elizabethkingia anophelis TaxID=1117645 RepID=UPI0038928B63
MQKKLIPLYGILLLSLLSSCRSENDVLALSKWKHEPQKAFIGSEKKFRIFFEKEEENFISKVKKYEIYKDFSNNNYYAYSFEELYNKYYEINKNAYRPKEGDFHIDYRVFSSLIEYENGDKGLIFPVVKNDVVEGLILNTIEEEGSMLRYHLLDEKKYSDYLKVKDLFSKQYSKILLSRIGLNASINKTINLIAGSDCIKNPNDWDCTIDPVVVPGKPKPKPDPNPFPQPLFPIPIPSNPGRPEPNPNPGPFPGMPKPFTPGEPECVRFGNCGNQNENGEEYKNDAALLDADCDVVKKWIATAKFKPSQANINKLKEIVKISSLRNQQMPGGINDRSVARIQDIDRAVGINVNMDYFPITITDLPTIGGRKLGPEQFLDYIRKNIGVFTDNSIAKFTPYNHYKVDDTALWESDRPLGAVVGIKMGPGLDNGSVMTSYHNGDKWTFTTIDEPWNGEHPVSGNRDFGFTKNTDGSYTFYTRGVDRLTAWEHQKAQDSKLLQFFGGTPFQQADALWTSYQNKVSSFVNSNNGKSSVVTPEILRPNYEKLKSVIEGKTPLSSLSKDCNK